MARNYTLRALDREEQLESIHRTNPVAEKAFRKGNASGAHIRDINRMSRRETKRQEQLAARGIFEDEEAEMWQDELADYEDDLLNNQ